MHTVTWKRDSVAPVRQLAAFDDLVPQAGALDDGGEPAGQAERGFAVAGGPPANLDAHDCSLLSGAYHSALRFCDQRRATLRDS